MKLELLKEELLSLSRTVKAQASLRFFKTGKGEYGEGDVFLGVSMPEQRKLAKKFRDLSLEYVEELLQSEEHEFRMTSLLILIYQFQKGGEDIRKKIYEIYLRNSNWINNWDLVDVSAAHIVGEFLDNKTEKIRELKKLAHSKLLWERRIAMMATFNYIKKGNHEEALQIAEILLNDPHDLIHKAVGWMLREVGKRCSMQEEEFFLKKYYQKTPRTTLRYAIEHFPKTKRQAYLKGNI